MWLDVLVYSDIFDNKMVNYDPVIVMYTFVTLTFSYQPITVLTQYICLVEYHLMNNTVTNIGFHLN